MHDRNQACSGSRASTRASVRAVGGIGICVALFVCANAPAGEWGGDVGIEYRVFPQAPLDTRQPGENLSLFGRLEYSYAAADYAFRAVPFFRLDQNDERRTHADLREFAASYPIPAGRCRLGVDKVFWGVTESVHLVDIVNQTDLVEDIDGEDKLGQPMATCELIGDAGALDLFALFGFRERRFAGIHGRPRSQPPVAVDGARYTTPRSARRADFALRWSRHAGPLDIGISYFDGTGREPRLVLSRDPDGPLRLIPEYNAIRQAGLDLQATVGPWLWKLEAIRRRGQGEPFVATAAGFEYTFTGVFGTTSDIGIIAEYLYDSRGAAATTPFSGDLALGTRIALNDVESTELLLAIIRDRHTAASFWSLESSRRIRSHWRLGIEGRAFAADSPDDRLYALRRDDYAQMALTYYY